MKRKSAKRTQRSKRDDVPWALLNACRWLDMAFYALDELRGIGTPLHIHNQIDAWRKLVDRRLLARWNETS